MPEKMASNSCFKYNFALVSRIANSFKDNSSFDLKSGQSIDIENARKEHEAMVEALRRLAVDVIELPCDEKHPDGLFVDDIAVVINGTALICNPPSIDGKPSRQGEVSAESFLFTRMQCLMLISGMCGVTDVPRWPVKSVNGTTHLESVRYCIMDFVNMVTMTLLIT